MEDWALLQPEEQNAEINIDEEKAAITNGGNKSRAYYCRENYIF